MSSQPVTNIPEWTLGDRLRKARALTGLNTREFASEIGVSQKTVTSAENDHGGVRRTTIAAYAVRTGVPMEWLETGNTPGPNGPEGDNKKLPRLDSNQQPFGYRAGNVIHLATLAA